MSFHRSWQLPNSWNSVFRLSISKHELINHYNSCATPVFFQTWAFQEDKCSSLAGQSWLCTWFEEKILHIHKYISSAQLKPSHNCYTIDIRQQEFKPLAKNRGNQCWCCELKVSPSAVRTERRQRLGIPQQWIMGLYGNKQHLGCKRNHKWNHKALIYVLDRSCFEI